jgi:hypothetical protein
LHKRTSYASDEGTRTQAIGSLVDLLALGRANDVVVAKCDNSTRYSGFSRLARYLSKEKAVVASLLSASMRVEEIREIIRELKGMKVRIAQLEARGKSQEKKIKDQKDRIAQLEARIQAMHNSRSWKITAPLRRVRTWFRADRRPQPGASVGPSSA